MRLRDLYKKQAVKHSSQTHWSMYRKTRNDLNLEMHLAKKKYFGMHKSMHALKLITPQKVVFQK